MTLFFPYSIILFSLSVQIEGDLCDRNAIAVFFRSQFNPIVFPGKDLAEQCDRAPVVIVHHHTAHAPSPRALRNHHLPGEGDRQRTDSLNGEPASKSALRIGFVAFFGKCVCGRHFALRYPIESWTAPESQEIANWKIAFCPG
jgi:hypothetical protein